ncbi:MAG: ABC transporter permease [Treponema sp.]|jgi:simple sugar transport system permease protein|nr:ABC transporter permease [Treponema sp.]
MKRYEGTQKGYRQLLPGPVFGTLIALGGAILVILLILGFNAPDPAKTMGVFFLGPWSSPWFLGNTLDHLGLLLTASLGTAIAFRGGCFNLGGEGQIYLGGLAASVVLLSGEGFPGWGALGLAGLMALAMGGALGALAGFLKKGFGAHELISSFLLTQALTPVGDYLIAGPLRDSRGNLVAMAPIPEPRLLLRLLPPSSLSISFIFAVFLVMAGHLFIHRTIWGYRFTIAGSAPGFARYGGIEPEACWVPAMSAAGALGGLTGFFAVAGTYGRCHLGFPGGLGWSSIAVALIARNRPLALIPTALVYGALKAGSDAALLATGLTFETAAFIQAAVLLLATVHVTAPLVKRRTSV